VPKAPENDLFSLDFHAPASVSTNVPSTEPKKDVKQDILSLFSTTPAAPAAFGQFGGQTANWGGTGPQQQPIPQQQPVMPTGMMGGNGIGMWGTSSGWTGAGAGAPSMAPQPNVWNTPAAGIPQQQQGNIFNTNAVWGASSAAVPATSQDLFGPASTSVQTQKNDDVFGDIWGGFK